MDVDLRQLRTLVVVVEEGTFGRAGRRLGYTQSSVSQQVAALERAVGGQLFDRPGGPGPSGVTPFGEFVLERGRRLVADAEDLGRAVERYRAGAGRLEIGTFESVTTVILPTLLSKLHQEHPDCEVRLSEGEPEDPRIGDLDLLFYDGQLDDDVESVKLLDDPYVLVARHGELPQGPVALSVLKGRAAVAWPTTCDQPRMERELRERDAMPRIVFRSASTEALLSMVRIGLGCAILPSLAAVGARDDRRLTIHPLDPAPSREVSLHWPRGRALLPVASRAIELAQDIANALPS